MGSKDSKMAKNTPHNIRLPLLALVMGAVAVAFAAILPKLAMDASSIGPIATGFWRLALAFPILLVAWLLGTRFAKPMPRRKSMSWFWLVLPGILFGFDLLTWHLSFPLTTAANATLLANLEVVLVGLVGWLILKEHLRWQFPLGAALALGGVVLLLVSGPPATEGRNPLAGDLLALLTAFWYASYLLSVKRARRNWTALSVITVGTAGGMVVLFFSTIISGESFIPDESEAWIYLLLLAIVPHCIGQGLIIFSLASLPASLAAVTLLLQPVGAACWGWLLLGEALNSMQILAGFIVLLGIGLARLGSGR
ncbi:MAG: DMT family transporter [Planctomycetota bacterium]|nr:DMT family transporter [Planctomycetota bacterium]